jgi:hypothetical protein
MFLKDGAVVAHAASDATIEGADIEAADAADLATDGAADAATEGDDIKVVAARPASDIPVSRSALAAIVIAAVATIVLGVLPGLGDGVLNAAAEALASLK